jgi:glycosyltransferase involved in cell wall biosynthesis
MKVAYVTTHDATDLKNWSGTAYHIAKSLEKQGVEIVHIGPLEDRGGALLGARRLVAKLLGGRSMLRERDPRVAAGYAAQVEERLRGLGVDWILSPGTIPIAELAVSTPIAFWTDATFAQMVDLYPEFRNLAPATLKGGNLIEQHALQRATLAIYSSEWAAGSAMSEYGADPAKVRVLPFGANLPGERRVDEIEKIIGNRGRDVCRLLFVGVDWERKGGDLAIAIVSQLHDEGVRAELTIVGSNPDIPAEMRNTVTALGFVAKDTTYGRSTLERLFASSHFLVLPSKAECFGVVLAEAGSFGMPSITSDVGGIPAVIRNGVNGFMFPIASIVEEGARCISSLWSDVARYDDLCRSAFEESRARLTWEASGRELRSLLEEMHPSRRSCATPHVTTPESTAEPAPAAAAPAIASRAEGGRRARGERTTGSAGRPLVSVITVVRNAAGHIAETIEAVLAQSYENVEYIIIDGASTDGTLDVIRRYDGRIDHWVSEPDAGIYDAMNKGVDLVSDPEAYVIFANADDRLFSPRALERAIELGGGADLIYGRMRLTDGDAATTMGREVEVSHLARETLCHPATLMRRRLFDTVGHFDLSFRIAADYDLIVRCFQQPVTSQFVDEIISEMRMGGTSEDRFMLSCRERKRVVRERFDSLTRLAGIWQVNLYDIPRNLARHWLNRAGLLGHWRALRRS